MRPQRPMDAKLAKRDARARSGWTIIEILMAIFVLAVAMGASAAAFLQNARLVEINRDMTKAVQAAQGILELELSRGFEGIVATHGLSELSPERVVPVTVDAATAPPDAVAQLRVSDIDGGRPGVQLLELRAALSWQSGGRTIGGTMDSNGLMESPIVLVTRLARNR